MMRCNAIYAAVIVVLVLILICAVRGGGFGRERFASERAREVTRKAQELFTRNGDVSYSNYKAAVPGADPVQFSDVRGLWKGGRLTPEAVDRVL